MYHPSTRVGPDTDASVESGVEEIEAGVVGSTEFGVEEAEVSVASWNVDSSSHFDTNSAT